MREKQKHSKEKWKVVIFVQSNKSYNINHNGSHAQQMEDDDHSYLAVEKNIYWDVKWGAKIFLWLCNNFLFTQKHMQEGKKF